MTKNKQAHANNHAQNAKVIHESKGFWIVNICLYNSSNTNTNKDGSHGDDPCRSFFATKALRVLFFKAILSNSIGMAPGRSTFGSLLDGAYLENHPFSLLKRLNDTKQVVGRGVTTAAKHAHDAFRRFAGKFP